MSRVYIAGPMRGIKNDNHEEFDRIEKMWKEAGHIPVSPAYMARALGKGNGNFESDDAFMRQVMIIDTVVICNCDAIALMKGWETSRGATMELALAQSIGLEVYMAESIEKVTLPTTPWAYLRDMLHVVGLNY